MTPEIISAVRNGGGLGRLMLGAELNLPTQGNSTGDLYFAQDTSKIFIWTGTAWRNFIADSTNKIAGIDVNTTGISDGEILQYSVIRNAFVPATKDTFTEADVTSTGEKGKLVLVGVDGKFHADIEGSATEISNVPVNLTGLREGYVLSYVKGTFVPGKKDEFDDSSSTTTGEPNKFVKVAEDCLIHANITGSAQALGYYSLDIADIEDGQILRFHEATGTFRNEQLSALGIAKALILRDGDKVLGDYNGGETVNVNFKEVLTRSTLSHEVAHLMRLTENLYLALDVAGLNPGGYDGLSGDTFYGNPTDIDTTQVDVFSAIQGDDWIDVDSVEGLIEGSHYILSDGVSFTTNLIPFVNEATGETTAVSRAHLVVKHQNVADAEITAEVALRDGVKFVKGEVIGIDDDKEQTVLLEHRDDVTAYKFALYFNGVRQTSGFEFSAILGQVTFNAANGVIVSADYYCDWCAETFFEMTKTGTYPDRRDPNRATTQFVYDGAQVLRCDNPLDAQARRRRITQRNCIFTGRPRGFKLAHQAVNGSIWVTPASSPWQFNEEQNAVIVTAPIGDTIRISYKCRSKEFSVDSFACTFNE